MVSELLFPTPAKIGSCHRSGDAKLCGGIASEDPRFSDNPFFFLVRQFLLSHVFAHLDPNHRNSLRIHSRLSTIRETRLLPRRPLFRKRKPPLPPASRTPSPNQRTTTTATPSTAAGDAPQPVMASAPTIAAVEPAAERRSRRVAAVPATGARTRTRPRRRREPSTKTM